MASLVVVRSSVRLLPLGPQRDGLSTTDWRPPVMTRKDRDETNVPAQQPEKSQEPRVPPSHVDPRRASDPQGSPTQGPPQAVGLTGESRLRLCRPGRPREHVVAHPRPLDLRRASSSRSSAALGVPDPDLGGQAEWRATASRLCHRARGRLGRRAQPGSSPAPVGPGPAGWQAPTRCLPARCLAGRRHGHGPWAVEGPPIGGGGVARARRGGTARGAAMTVPARLLRLVFRGWQVLRAGRPSPCRFDPTCSAYGITAVERFGALRGGILTLRRLGRCHPWGRIGLDPVPERTDRTT